MAEIALVSARKSKLEDMSSKGDLKAKAALNLTENPQLFLSTAQIGITLIAILTGFYSGEKFSEYLRPYIEKIPYLHRYAANISTALIMVICNLSVHSFRRADTQAAGPAESRTDRADCGRTDESFLPDRIPDGRLAELAEQSFFHFVFHSNLLLKAM